MHSETEVLDETDIGFYGEPDIQFHINSGRTWESKTTYKFDEDGNKTESHTINKLFLFEVLKSMYNDALARLYFNLIRYVS
jgi:hypothetical protein